MGHPQACQRMWGRVDGRAGLGEDWKPTLINRLVAIVCFILDQEVSALVPVWYLDAVAGFLPALRLSFPSLHDQGRSGCSG
ncbi:MAG: DUF805 domain-containing protein [Candidatus Dormibacteria bacterium]